MATHLSQEELRELTADIVGAYVAKNPIPVAGLPDLVASVSASLLAVSGAAAEPSEPQKPAVSLRSAVRPDSIACFECGKRFKSLRRHLNTGHGLSVDEYRQKWDLRPDFPMAAPEYSERRSAFAKSAGLGRKPGETAPKRRASKK